MDADHRPSADLLESTHLFPGTYQIRAIGQSSDDFVDRILSAVAEEVASPSEIDHSTRFTPGRRHVSVTLEITVQSADQVRAIYARIQQVPGLTLLF
jgi:putative lipoic acid-binding regulatory protein